MRKSRAAVLAGIAALAVAGTAMAASHDSHVLKVAMPDGSIARIEYQGDVAPQVVVAPAQTLSVPVAFDPFDAAPFAMFDRIAEQMDRQADAMMRQVAALASQPAGAGGQVDLAAFGKLPAGTVHYSFVSTSSGNGTCSRSVQVTSLGADQAPKIVSNSSGDCGNSPQAAPAVASQAPAAPAVTKVNLKTSAGEQAKAAPALPTI